MKIETKFDKNDTAYLIGKSGKIYKATVQPSIDITYWVAYNPRKVQDECGQEYFECDEDLIQECELFATKEEAKAKLKEMQNGK